MSPISWTAFLTITVAFTTTGDVNAGSLHTCGSTTSTVAYCWGANDEGELGIGTRTGPEACFGTPCSSRPTEVDGGRVFQSLQSGKASSCGVTTANLAFCWGANTNGQLGNGTTQRRLKPRRVAGAV